MHVDNIVDDAGAPKQRDDNGKRVDHLSRDSLSVADKKHLFEQLATPRTVASTTTKTSKDRLPPPKPTRTFAHDHYFNPTLTSKESSTTVGPSKPALKPKPSFAPRQRLPPKIFPKPRLINGKRISHEYEHILATRSPLVIREQNLRRSLSADSLIYAQAISVAITADADAERLPLYYASSPVPRPPIAADGRVYDAPIRKIDGEKSEKRSSPSKLRRRAQDSLPLNRQRNDHQTKDGLDLEPDSNVSPVSVDKRVNRARLMRRRTLMHYDQQEIAFIKRQYPQLFELAALVRLEPNDGSNPMMPRDQKYAPTVVYNFPSSKDCGRLGNGSVLASLPCLCYPDVSKAVLIAPDEYKDEQFVMTITDQFGDRKFAYCYRFVPCASVVEKSNEGSSPSGKTVHLIGSNSSSSTFFCSETVLNSLPQVFCIVTPVQAPNFYLDFVREGASKAKRIRVGRDADDLVELKDFLQDTFWKPLPPPGGNLVLAGPSKSIIISHRLSSSRGIVSGMSLLVERIGIDRSILLFTALLSERRVLLVGDAVPSVSKAVQAAAAFLMPFEWPHTFVPVVPDPYVHLCFSPTPYLMGLLRSNLSFLKDLLVGPRNDKEDEEYILILDLDYGVVKDKDFVDEVGAGLSSNTSHRCIPARTARALRESLRSAVNSSTDCSVAGIPTTLSENRDTKVSDAFLAAFIDLVGHYKEFLVTQQDGQVTFQKQQFINDAATMSHKSFLKWFVETGMFQVWLKKKLDSAFNGRVGGNGRKSVTLGTSALADAFDRKLDQMKLRQNQTSVAYQMLVNAVTRRWLSFVRRTK